MLTPLVHRELCCLASLPCSSSCRPSPAPPGRGAVPGGLAARVASGPGFWTEWLAEPDRQGLLEDLLADGVIARALREAPTGHRYDRVLTAKMTVICVLVACLFPGDGYDAVLAKAFGLPGLRFKPGAGVPAGQRVVPGPEAARRAGHAQDLRAGRGRSDAELGITALWKGLEVTAHRRHHDGARPERRAGLRVRHARGRREATAADSRARPHRQSRRWISAEIGSYHDGENDLADKLEWSFRPGMLNLADRGFFSMDRFLRFSASGATWPGASRTPRNGFPSRPSGSSRTALSWSCCTSPTACGPDDGADTGNPHAERLPDTTARLITFTILTARPAAAGRRPRRSGC